MPDLYSATESKKISYGKTIPVFVLTSATYVTGFKFSASTAEEKEWIKCDEIVNKPVVIDDLVQKIEGYYACKVSVILFCIFNGTIKFVLHF
ncbi:MAG: hypothetical protein MZV64_20565 [Ignavibacteriales bacterium]|nr:hypothetical protein [Ignavibacteriales bacterium]